MTKKLNYGTAPAHRVNIRLVIDGEDSASLDTFRFKTVQAMISQYNKLRDKRPPSSSLKVIVSEKGSDGSRSITNPRDEDIWNYLAGGLDTDTFFGQEEHLTTGNYWLSIFCDKNGSKLTTNGSEMRTKEDQWSWYYQFSVHPQVAAALCQYLALPPSEGLLETRALRLAEEYFEKLSGETLMRPMSSTMAIHVDWVLFELMRERVAFLITQELPVDASDIYDCCVRDFLTICDRNNAEPPRYCYPTFSQMAPCAAQTVRLFVDFLFVELYAQVYEPITFSVRPGE